MSKLYTVDKYKEAVFSLAEHHNYTALEYEGDDEYTLIFRIFEKGNKIPIGMWPNYAQRQCPRCKSHRIY
jgi:hypothetical protein